MALSDIAKAAQALAHNHSTSILTGVGVAGTVSTAVLTARASFQAVKVLHKEVGHRGRTAPIPCVVTMDDISAKDKARLTWKLYIPPFAVGTITVTSIILANRVAGKEAAALMAAYTVSDRAFTEYREKVSEKLGATKEGQVRDAIAEARMQTDPLNSREIIIAGTGEVLCYDIFSGRYFQSSKNEILAAENVVNAEVVSGTMSCSLSRFYDEIGLTPNGMSDETGFNANRLCKVRFSTQESSDGRPCLAIDFIESPAYGYSKLWD